MPAGLGLEDGGAFAVCDLGYDDRLVVCAIGGKHSKAISKDVQLGRGHSGRFGSRVLMPIALAVRVTLFDANLVGHARKHGVLTDPHVRSSDISPLPLPSLLLGFGGCVTGDWESTSKEGGMP